MLSFCQKWLLLTVLLITPGGEPHTSRIKAEASKRRGNAAEESTRRSRRLPSRSPSLVPASYLESGSDRDSDNGDVYLTATQRAHKKTAAKRKEQRQASRSASQASEKSSRASSSTRRGRGRPRGTQKSVTPRTASPMSDISIGSSYLSGYDNDRFLKPSSNIGRDTLHAARRSPSLPGRGRQSSRGKNVTSRSVTPRSVTARSATPKSDISPGSSYLSGCDSDVFIRPSSKMSGNTALTEANSASKDLQIDRLTIGTSNKPQSGGLTRNSRSFTDSPFPSDESGRVTDHSGGNTAELSRGRAPSGRSSRAGTSVSYKQFMSDGSDEDVTSQAKKHKKSSDANKDWTPRGNRKIENQLYPSADRMKWTRSRQGEIEDDPSDNTVIPGRKRRYGESDTDEEKDDVKKPKKCDPFKLRLNICPTCLAQMYQNDRTCCQHGRVFLPAQRRFPKYMEDKFFGNSPLAKKFRSMILTLNTIFSFASLQCHRIEPEKHGPPVVKVQGPVNSFPSCANPLKKNAPKFGNFYVYTGDEALEMRKKMYQTVDKEILADLQKVMDEHNTLGKCYRRMGEMIKKAEDVLEGPHQVRMKIIDACQVDEKSLQGHRGIYRSPVQKGDYIAVFYTASVEQHVTLPGLIIYPIKNSNKPMRPIFYHDPKISPLCYPLLFPYGEYGYQRNHFPLESDQEKPFWVRFVEYYESRREELAESEANVTFDEALKLAKKDGYKKKPAAPKKTLSPGISDNDCSDFKPSDNSDSEPEEQEAWNIFLQDLDVNTVISEDEESMSNMHWEIDDSCDEPFHLKRARIEDKKVEETEVVDRDLTEQQEDDILDSSGSGEDPPEAADVREEEELQEHDPNVDCNYSDADMSDEDDGGPKKIQNKGKRKCATRKEYELYRAQRRSFIKNRFNWGGKVSQLYLIQAVTQLYQQRSAIWKSKCMEFLNSTKSRFLKAFNRKARKAGKLIGCLARIPAAFPGSPRWLQQHFLNAVTLANHLGKCDLFITATCNVNWEEIKSRLEPGQTWEANPFLVNQVFNEKLKLLMEVIEGKKKSNGAREKGIFGHVRWSTYSIEFQQRGPPHAHIVVALKRKIKTIAQIEKVCQARLPADPDLRNLVESFMIHRPCEGDNEAYCRKQLRNKKQKQCKKNFPKEFSDTTKAGDRNYPELKRPDDGETTRKDPKADNRYVVPYNTELLSLWHGHMNVEVISTLRVVKYIFKYLFKGFDRVLVESINNLENMDMSQMTIDGHIIYPSKMDIPDGLLEQRQKEAEQLLKSNGIPTKNPDNPKEKVLVYDEYVQHQDLRAITSCEAAWELASYPRFGCSHVIFWQTVHEEHDEPIFYKKGEEEEMLKRIKNKGIPTPFKAWFKLNEEDQDAHKYTFAQIGVYYTYRNGKWVKKRKIRRNALGTIATVNPLRKELFAIRLLALRRKGITSFKHLRTVDGVALGLMNDEKEWFDCLEEASSKDDPRQLRRLFVLILTSNPVMYPRKLWDSFKDQFFERRPWKDATLEAHALYHIQSLLKAHGKSLEDYNLPDIKEADLPPKDDLIDDSGRIPRSWYKENAPKMIEGLTPDQRKIFDRMFSVIKNREPNNAFFLQGSGGTGKTVLLKALFYNLLAENKNVACVAHTGNAATLLPKGSTAHRYFHIPLTVEDGMQVKITLESPEAISLEKINCIIWDEATMTDRRIYEAIDTFFRTIHHDKESQLFGGVPFIMTGDWKQTLPIVNGVRGAETIKYTLLEWERWNEIQVLQLTKNMRAADDPEFAAFLEDVGRGIGNMITTGRRPEDQLFDMTKLEEKKCFVPSPLDVIKKVFGTKGKPEDKLKDFEDAAILTVDNKSMNEFNEVCLKELLTGTTKTLRSIDEYDPKTGFQALDPESYHNATPSGMPPHALKLKIGAIVMLLRNMSTDMGLTNGTRMVVEGIGNRLIFCRPLTRKRNTPELVALPRVVFAPANALSREVAFKRLQFPVKLAFAMTCNKAQGQTLKRVGIILRTPCFSHGQFYVALSRVRSFKDLTIYNAADNHLITNNVIFKRVYQLLERSINRQANVRGRMPTRSYTGRNVEQPRETSVEWTDQSGDSPLKRNVGTILSKLENFHRNLRNQPKNDRATVRKIVRSCAGRNTVSSPSPSDQFDSDVSDGQSKSATRKGPTRASTARRGTPVTTGRGKLGPTLSKNQKKRVDDSDVSMESSPVKMGMLQRKLRSSTKRKEFIRDSDESDRSGREPARKAKKLINMPIIHEQEELGFEQRNCLILHNPSVFCFANVVVQSCFRIWKDKIFSDTSRNPILTELRNVISAKGRETVQGLLDRMPGFVHIAKDANGIEHQHLKTFNDGNQHDAEEFWSALINELGGDYCKQFNIQECYEHVCQTHKRNREICGHTTRTRPTDSGRYLEIHAKLRRGANLEDYLSNLMELEKAGVEKGCCKCPGDHTNKEHTRRPIISIPSTTHFLAVRINLRNSISSGREHFIDRKMARVGGEIRAFDHTWQPMVQIKHVGSQDRSTGGHYIAYLKNTHGWLEVDDQTSPTQKIEPPPTDNICFVILKKITELENDGKDDGSIASRIVKSMRDKFRPDPKPTSAFYVPSPTKSSTKKELVLFHGDMFSKDLRADAVVNAANRNLTNGGGVCKAVFMKAGINKLENECGKILKTLPGGVLPPGGAVATTGCNQTALKCIVHTAAPDMKLPAARRNKKKSELILRMCYINACRCAADHGGTRVVFPILGIGIYGYDRRQGLAVAIQSMFAYFEAYPQTTLQSVTLSILDDRIYEEAKALMRAITRISFRPEEAKALRLKFEHDYEDRPRPQDGEISKTNVRVGSFIKD